MSNISCDVCMDLIPLVKDNVASEDSCLLVHAHIENCESCRKLYETVQTEIPVMNEEPVLSKIKNQLFLIAVGIVVFGAMIGVALSDSMGMFYNILIMPAIGVIGYFSLRKKAYLMPVALLLFSYVWNLIKYSFEQINEQGFTASLFIVPIYWSIIYAVLCGIGVLIAFLLRISFEKGDTNDV